jgi:hypothetical protein
MLFIFASSCSALHLVDSDAALARVPATHVRCIGCSARRSQALRRSGRSDRKAADRRVPHARIVLAWMVRVVWSFGPLRSCVHLGPTSLKCRRRASGRLAVSNARRYVLFTLTD